MSLSSILSIARTALLSQQKALDVTGHNIANASTEGYTRQRLRLTAAVPLQTPIGQVGRGVTADGIERIRSSFLDTGFRQENGLLGQYSTSKEMLDQVEGVFGEPSDNGLGAGIDQFLSAFGDLANNPSDLSSRQVLTQAATALTRQFNSLDQRISAVGQDAQARIASVLSDVNSFAAQIADLNTRIVAGESNGKTAPDLRDARDLLVDKVSSLMSTRVVQHPNGSIGLLAGDSLLVDGSQSAVLQSKTLASGATGIGFTTSASTFDPGAGTLKALTEITSKTIPSVRAQLDSLAKGIVTEVNKLHAAGKTLTGATGLNFFDPTGLTAATMSVSASVLQSTSNIAAGTSGGVGDGSVALAIAGFRTTALPSFGNQTVNGAYTGLVASIGVLTRDAGQNATAQDTIVANVDSQRSSMSGVSVDEELTNMIEQQHAFAAAARMVTVADQMIQSVLAMVQ
ncbi:MAG: flagellar hook-associated protein FlgK [Gemmatimonadota bacterium]